jgi:hypothetical protein
MTRKTILLTALVGVLLATATAFASLSGAKGYADRIALRENYSQYEGKTDLRDSSGNVIFYYWGGARCGSSIAPTERQVDVLLSAHLNGHDVSLDYNDFVSALGTSRCWDGGIQVY